MAEGDPTYVPREPLFLWWLGEPAAPRLIGQLRLALGGRAVSLEYDGHWLREGFALSEDLPLVPGLWVPNERDRAVGAVDDARPDRWGERVIRRFEASSRLSILEFLLFAGDERHGALGVSLSGTDYRAWSSSPVPGLASLAEMDSVVRKVLANEPVAELQRRLLRPGVSLGGARPKALLRFDGHDWLVKFDEGDDLDMPLIEHATMSLASACGIAVAQTQALALGPHRHAVAVRRFDRVAMADGPARRLHAQSAHVALSAAGEDLGYPQLAQLLRRLAPAAQIAAQQGELFRRMVFNILVDNTDDHEKNHCLLMPDAALTSQGWLGLSPAFDVTPALQGIGQQAMAVGERGGESTLDNALSQCAAFGLRREQAQAIVRAVARGVENWQAHWRRHGVRESDIEVAAQYLDGPQLGAQRRAWC